MTEKKKEFIIQIEDNNPDEINLERLQYEIDAKKDLLTWMLSSNTISDRIEAYEKEYQNTFIEYQKAKHLFENKYVRTAMPNDASQLISWNLDFETRKVSCIYE